MVFYFSATGNSLYVARELETATGGEAASIPHEMRRGGRLAYHADAIGLVYPIYGHMMPTMVRQFVERATFDTPYFYVVCTYGNRHASAVELACDELHTCGVNPAYVTTLLMVDNWLPSFDMDEQRARIPEKRIDESLARIRADIAERRRWIEPVSDTDRAAHEEFLSRGIRFEPADLGDFLRIDTARCVGCGICAKVCPAGCIAMTAGACDDAGMGGRRRAAGPKPAGPRRHATRKARADLGCNACLACIHACPHGAIELPMGEANPHARWRNEHVSLRDLERANGS